MIDFSTVTREFRSLIGRRRELQTLLGSVFAGLGIFLQNSLQGNLPTALGGIQRHLFAFYAIMLMVPSLILALRMARLHGGLVLNGILFAHLMQEQSFTPAPDIAASARHNYAGVSFLQFVMVNLIAAFSVVVLVMALGAPLSSALGAGAIIGTIWMVLYFRFHHRAATFALEKIKHESAGPVVHDEWEEHISKSLEDANLGLNNDVAFTGLIVFSVFETLAGIGQMKSNSSIDLAPRIIQDYGPIAYIGLMTIICFMCMIGYIRVRVAIGKSSLFLDPTDRPFTPLKLTDSLMGYMILAFLFVVSMHLLLGLLMPPLQDSPILLLVDALLFGAAILAEQLTLVRFRAAFSHLQAARPDAVVQAKAEAAVAPQPATPPKPLVADEIPVPQPQPQSQPSEQPVNAKTEESS